MSKCYKKSPNGGFLFAKRHNFAPTPPPLRICSTQSNFVRLRPMESPVFGGVRR